MKQLLSIIKVGGNIIDDDTALNTFIDSFSRLNGQKILVHGGGKLATRLAAQLGIEQQLVDGRRITDQETLKIVTMVYGGYVNKKIVAMLQARGTNAIGLTGADGNLLLARKRNHPTIDYGFVGDIEQVNTKLINKLVEQGNALVIAPLTHDLNGNLLNTNADTIAGELANALSGEHDVQLIYSFERAGVLKDVNDEGSVISKINRKSYEQLKSEQLIFAGMLPKLDNAFMAISKGVKKVIIGKAEALDDLVNGRSGTTIVNE